MSVRYRNDASWMSADFLELHALADLMAHEGYERGVLARVWHMLEQSRRS